MSSSPISNDRDRPLSERPHRNLGPRWLREAVALTLSIFLCFATAAIGAWATNQSLSTWYPGLNKPAWNPPNWIFGPVWTLLYLMMAVAAWLVWRERHLQATGRPLLLFGVQLALNLLWSILFFAAESPGAAFAEIVILWLTILATLLTFWRVRPLAGALLVPYLAWVSFAAALNFAIWQLNR